MVTATMRHINHKHKAEAERLFFDDKKSIAYIADALGITKKTVGRYLRQSPLYAAEKSRRQAENKASRAVYQKSWASKKRSGASGSAATGRLGDGITEAAILRSQHFLDVNVLSYEKF